MPSTLSPSVVQRRWNQRGSHAERRQKHALLPILLWTVAQRRLHRRQVHPDLRQTRWLLSSLPRRRPVDQLSPTHFLRAHFCWSRANLYRTTLIAEIITSEGKTFTNINVFTNCPYVPKKPLKVASFPTAQGMCCGTPPGESEIKAYRTPAGPRPTSNTSSENIQENLDRDKIEDTAAGIEEGTSARIGPRFQHTFKAEQTTKCLQFWWPKSWFKISSQPSAHSILLGTENRVVL